MFKRYKQKRAREKAKRIKAYSEEYRNFSPSEREGYRWSLVCWAASTYFRNEEILERCAAAADVCWEEAKDAHV